MEIKCYWGLRPSVYIHTGLNAFAESFATNTQTDRMERSFGCFILLRKLDKRCAVINRSGVPLNFSYLFVLYFYINWSNGMRVVNSGGVQQWRVILSFWQQHTNPSLSLSPLSSSPQQLESHRCNILTFS